MAKVRILIIIGVKFYLVRNYIDGRNNYGNVEIIVCSEIYYRGNVEIIDCGGIYGYMGIGKFI